MASCFDYTVRYYFLHSYYASTIFFDDRRLIVSLPATRQLIDGQEGED